MTGVERCNNYVQDVKSGKILTNRHVRLAIRRYEKDLERSRNNDPNFPYVFSEEKANRFIQFTECLKQYNDQWKGKELILEPWQCFCFANIYGWVHKDTGLRRFRKAFIFVARKNGKSHMVASTLLYDILTTNGAMCFCAATKREQSKLVYNVCVEMIKQNPALSKRLGIYKSTSRIINESKSGYIEALSAEADTFDGLNPSCVVIDEVAAMKDYNIIKVLASGQGSRPEALMFEITSGSDNLQSAGKREWDISKDILEGAKEDDSFFCILYGLDEKDDWKNPKNFIKANPNLNVSIKEEWLLKQLKEALNNPSLEGEFRTKNLGQYISPLKAWIQPRIWSVIEKNAADHKLDKSKPYYAVLSIDLSKRNDLTALSLCCYQEGYFYLKHRYFFPLESLQEKIAKDNDLWMRWVEQDLVTGTYGRIIDYDYVKSAIEEFCSQYEVQGILFDPYNSTKLIEETESLNWIEINQSMKFLSPLIKSAEEEIFTGHVVDDNPVEKWMALNAEVYRDPNDNLKIIKADKDSPKRIDGIITACMAIGYIKKQIEEGNVDLRTEEEKMQSLEDMLASLNI